MYSLIVKHKGKSLQEIELQANTIYIAGRSHDNQIVLSEQVGISRKHLEISLQDNKLIVKKLSSLHTLTQDGEEKENLELSVGQTFQVQNYEFLLKKNLKENPSSQKTEYMAEDIIKQETQHFSLAGRLNPLVEKPEEELSCNGKTAVLPTEEVNKKLIAYLKVSTNEKSPHDIYKPGDQQEWALGRELSCDIIINNINIWVLIKLFIGAIAL